ncbi:hypothetical protein KOR42_13200 [Thalassoglobus neptunius]|uniref:Uncharacterized protein n=1 Tax=Thalassoglobus neptunius TaxID=1938619 RepID=A0A5C5X7L8_9PLAN|nr:hypothetical protein KOR42_13200 [Thalassoglobus neptunius]
MHPHLANIDRFLCDRLLRTDQCNDRVLQPLYPVVSLSLPFIILNLWFLSRTFCSRPITQAVSIRSLTQAIPACERG